MKTYLAGELRFVARRLLRSPGFTAAATLTLALGIGANTAIFSLINTALLRPLPFAQPDRLVVLWERQRAQGKEREPVSAENFLDWRRGARTFSELAAWKSWGFALSGAGEPEELPAIRASANLFRLLQAVPALGRGLLAEDETPGRDRVAILSHALWARRFGSDPATVGRSILLDGEPYTVVGVMPAGFRFPNDPTVAVWTPLGFSPQVRVSRGERQFIVLGRLAPGVTLEQAQVELDLIARGLAAAHPASNSGWGVTLVPAIEAASGGSRRPLLLLLGTVGLVLLIACANVGHLFLARAADRERELAVRVALGAAPSRLLRLLLLESGVVALLGSVAGIVLAVWTVPVIQALDPGMLPGWREARLDGRVLLFTAALLLLTTLACGLLPALQLLRLELRSPLAEAGSRLSAGVRRSRLRQGLIVGEVALSALLLLAAGLLLRSLNRLQQVDPGFEPDRVLAATIFLSGLHEDNAREVAFFTELVERLSRLPGVEAAGGVTTLPMNPVGIDYDLPFSADDRQPAPGEEQQVDFRLALGDYFRTLGIPLLRGRFFDATDRKESPRVVIVNQVLVHRFFEGADPVGRKVWIGGGIGEATVVGVVGEVRHRGLDARPTPEMYVPFAQYPHGGMTVVLRAPGDPLAMARALETQVYAVDPNQPINDLVTLPQLLSDSVSPRRFTLLLLGSFAVLALVLSAIGVYGVIAYSVSQRTRELGIRIALGARSREVHWAVARPGLLLVTLGLGLGAAGGWLLSRVLASELYEISPHDPATFGAAALLIFAVAWAACALPALRATRIDPIIALRSE